MGSLVLLGPQRHAPVLREVCQDLKLLDDGRPLALISAGWEEREAEDQDLRDHLSCEVVNLSLHGRTERAFAEDTDLFDALRRRHDRMRRQRTVYRRRLDHAVSAWLDVLRPAGAGDEDEFFALGRLESGDHPLMAEVLEEADQALRVLDAGHLRRVTQLQAEFEDQWRPAERPAMARECEQVAEQLAGCAGLLVAGGHVAVLLNRLRLFGLSQLLGDRPLVAWSAGAMVVTERIVLFHDSPPQGRGAAEVFEPGLCLARGIVALPDAGQRLLLDDPLRVTALARRMAPALCVPLDAGERAVRRARGWATQRVLAASGSVVSS